MDFLIKYKSKIVFYLIAVTAVSFLLSLALMQLFLAVLIIFWLFGKDKVKAFDPISMLFASFVLIRIISIFTSEYTGLSYPALYKEALFFLGFFALSYHLKKYEYRKKEMLIEIFVYTSVLVSLIGITLFVLGIKHRAQSYMSGYATFSTYLLFAFSFFLYLVNCKKNLKTWHIVLIGSIILTGIVLALSRTDVGIAAMVILAALIFRKIKFLTITMIVVITALACFGAFSVNSSEFKVRVKQPATLSDRDILWKTAYERSGEHIILGHGPRTFDSVFTHRDKLADKGIGGWHNDYIAVFIESGALGLLAFLLFIAYILKQNIVYYYKNKTVEPAGTFFWVLLVCISANMLSAFFSGFIVNPILAKVFAFTVALLSSEVFPMRQEIKNP